jgi:hypothetical protein
MKNKSIMVLAVMFITAGCLRAQEYKVPKSTGRLEIKLGKVSVEGHTGNEIIFTSADGQREKDKRAEGLRSVNSLGLDDNTGLGINVTVNGGRCYNSAPTEKDKLARRKDPGS